MGGWGLDCPSKTPDEMSCRKAHNLDREWYLFFFFSPNQFLSPLVLLLTSLAAMLSMHSFKHLFLLCLIFSPFSSGFHSVFYLLLLPMPSPPFLCCSLFSFNAQHLCVFFSLCCLQCLLLTWSFCMFSWGEIDTIFEEVTWLMPKKNPCSQWSAEEGIFHSLHATIWYLRDL